GIKHRHGCAISYAIDQVDLLATLRWRPSRTAAGTGTRPAKHTGPRPGHLPLHTRQRHHRAEALKKLSKEGRHHLLHPKPSNGWGLVPRFGRT
ncbi:hypothetical protein M885DRAFT_509024, partial [Pelagophyceae sp. CCMP2097]